MNRGVLFLLVAVGAAVAAAYWSADAGATDAPVDAPDDGSTGWTDAISGATAAINPFAMINKNSAMQDASDANVQATLAAIKYAEGSSYTDVYGYAFKITDFSDHPANLGWKGGAITRGKYAGQVSTASGAYQINGPTWNTRVMPALGMPDFSPASQDAAAVWLITKAGALDAAKSGDIETFCSLCHGLWASLPGSDAGQGGKTLDQVAEAFTNAGGTLA